MVSECSYKLSYRRCLMMMMMMMYDLCFSATDMGDDWEPITDPALLSQVQVLYMKQTAWLEAGVVATSSSSKKKGVRVAETFGDQASKALSLVLWILQ